MKSNYKVVLQLNDIFDELREENKRLHNYLKVLNKFRELLNKISVKYETIIDSEDKQHFNRLNEEFKSVVKDKEQIEETIGVTVDIDNENVTQECEEITVSVKNETITESEDRHELNTGLISEDESNGHDFEDSSSDSANNESSTEEPLIKGFGNKRKKVSKYLDNTSKDKDFVCDYEGCHKSYSVLKSLYSHIQMSHNLKKKYFCEHNDCNKGFTTRKSLRTHSLSHSDIKPFKCLVNGCNKSYKIVGHLNRHQLTHSDIRSYKCNECQKCFKTKDVLIGHEARHKGPTIKCLVEDCHELFHSREALDKHKYLVHNIKDKMKQCMWPGCDYETLNASRFAEHNSLHTGVKPFLCQSPNCGKRFSAKVLLTTHMRQRHSHTKHFACVWPGCEHRSKTKGELKSHQRVHRIRENTKELYKCHLCVFETTFEDKYNTHNTRFHSDNSELFPFECDSEGCTKRFRTKQSKWSHNYAVHTPKPLVSCDWPGCEYTTHQKDYLKVHKLTHIGAKTYQCDFEGCAKSFVTPNTLRMHKLHHTKRFVCSWPECGQAFNFKNTFNAHTNTHLNVRPFKCSFIGCNKDFTTKKYVRKHLAIIHNIKAKDIEKEDN